MYCTKCGVELESEDRFCSRCGAATRPGYVPSGRRAPLSRPMDQRKIAGVCAGFARYFDTDVVLMRILWVGGAILSGGLLGIAYLFAWALMPRDYPPVAAQPHRVAQES